MIHRNWMFTDYCPVMCLDIDNSNIGFCVYQKERCPSTGREHYQGYIEFNRSMEMAKVVKLFGCKCHVEPRKGNQQQAIDYCMKKDTRIENPVSFGNKKHQGSRSDLESINEAILSGQTPAQILISFGGNALRHINHIKTACVEIWGLEDNISEKILSRKQTAKGLSDKELMDLLIARHS